MNKFHQCPENLTLHKLYLNWRHEISIIDEKKRLTNASKPIFHQKTALVNVLSDWPLWNYSIRTNCTFKTRIKAEALPVPDKKWESIFFSPLLLNRRLLIFDRFRYVGNLARGMLWQVTSPKLLSDLEQVHSGLNTQGGWALSSLAPTALVNASTINTKIISKFLHHFAEPEWGKLLVFGIIDSKYLASVIWWRLATCYPIPSIRFFFIQGKKRRPIMQKWISTSWERDR